MLEGLSRLIAPIVPFVSEEIYQNLTNNESVHLSDFPKSDVNYINEEIEAKMDLIRDLISLGRAGREEAKIKVRQPISEIIIDGKHEALIGDLTELIKEELNVKNITFTPDLSLYMNFIVIPNYKVAGPMFGPKIKLFANALNNLTKEQVKDVNNQKNIVINIDDKDYEVTPDMVEIRITSKEGFNANMQNNRFIILNTALNQELLDEGIARELVSKVQQMRKSKDFDVVDRINIYYNGNDDFKRVIEKHNDFIKRETLAVDIIYKETAEEKVNLNDLDVALEVSKIGE